MDLPSNYIVLPQCESSVSLWQVLTCGIKLADDIIHSPPEQLRHFGVLQAAGGTSRRGRGVKGTTFDRKEAWFDT